jgi:hypothetical protein
MYKSGFSPRDILKYDEHAQVATSAADGTSCLRTVSTTERQSANLRVTETEGRAKPADVLLDPSAANIVQHADRSALKVQP